MCAERKLVSHGYYERGYTDPGGGKHDVQVPRVRCRGCKQAYTCLYEFLIPYRRYGVEFLEYGLFMYLSQFCSYAEALWSSSEAETSMAVSTLWHVMSSILRNVQLAQIYLQLGLEEAGRELLAVEGLRNFCENAMKARLTGRAELLHRAAGVAAMARQFLEGEPIAALHRYFLRIERPFYFLLGRRSVNLSGPHNTEWLIF